MRLQVAERKQNVKSDILDVVKDNNMLLFTTSGLVELA
jgi:hypothetical protein